MKPHEIYSKEWCDLIFRERNQEYGAYKIRKNAGRRLRFALIVVCLCSLLFAITPVAFSYYMKYQLAKGFEHIEQDIKNLKKLEHKDGFEIKQVSAGRGRPSGTTLKDAVSSVPEISEVSKADIRLGTAGPEDIIIEADPVSLTDTDTLHNRNRLDLPVEGAQLSAVEVVEEMPQFPGGPHALMAWLDRHIPYPQSCIKRNIRGEMQVTFLVNAEGRVIEPAISKPLHPELDSIALGALRVMPRWNPGREGGRVTIVRITIPILFEPK